MDSVFEDVKSVIMDVLKIDGKNITPETRFIEDLRPFPMKMPQASRPSVMS